MRTHSLTAALALAGAAAVLFQANLSAQATPRPGPVIHSAGAVYDVHPDVPTPQDLTYRVAFEVADPASSPEALHQGLNTVARFINMHARAGVPRERIRAAVVVHGPAAWTLLDDAAYQERFGTANPNAELLRELLDFGTRVMLCGQTAAARGVPTDRLVDGVQVALSAMTAFVMLQEEGYRVNPW